MSDARAAILAKVRLGLGRQQGDVPPPAPRSAGITLDNADDLEQRLRERLAATGVTLENLPGKDALPEAVARYVERHALVGPVAVAPSLAKQEWSELSVEPGSARPHHAIGVGEAFAAIAATGSLVMLANSSSPARLNFLPEHHLVVLSKQRLLGRLEHLWPLLRGCDSQAVHLITGPSSTADIGGQLLFGAHGPRAVRVLLTP